MNPSNMKKADYEEWFETACEHGVSEEFLRAFPEHVNWNDVSYAQAIPIQILFIFFCKEEAKGLM